MARTCILRALGFQMSYDVFFWCYACFVLLRFSLYAFFEAATYRSIVLRYAGAPISTRISFFFFPFCLFRDVDFSSIFCTIAAFSLNGKYVVRSFLLRMVFFYLLATGWVFDISLCENSINQSIRVFTWS